MDAWCASTDIQLCFTCISQVIIMVLCPVSIYMFKKDSMKFGANPRNSHKNNYWDGRGKVYDEKSRSRTLGSWKDDIKYQVFEGILEGKKARYFLFYRRPNKKAFLRLRFVLQPENSVCVQGALDWKGDSLSEGGLRESAFEEGLYESATLLPDQLSWLSLRSLGLSLVLIIQQAFHLWSSLTSLFLTCPAYFTPHIGIPVLHPKSTTQDSLLSESSQHTDLPSLVTTSGPGQIHPLV